MRNLNLSILMMAFCLSNCVVSAQKSKGEFPAVDASPMDVSYFPNNLPMNTTFNGVNDSPIAKIYYGRPSKKGRVVFGNLVPYGQIWRLGANEATEIVLYKSATIGSTKIPAGTYSLAAIPEKNKWIIILNKKTATWGHYSYESSMDVVRVEVPTKKTSTTIETFAIYFKKTDSGALMIIGWEDTSVELPIKL